MASGARRRRRLALVTAASLPALAAAGAARGQEVAAQAFDFSETIVVSGTLEDRQERSFETRHALDAQEVARIDAASADEVIRRLPGVHVPVNSRGEAIAFVRNAGERQVAVFFEGADINVPWDNRLDLSLLPAGLVGSVRTAAGPLAPHYGVNALGALSLSPAEGLYERTAYGSGDRLDFALGVPLGPLQVGGSYTRRDGETLSDDAAVPFGQLGDDLRTNTDREIGSIYGRLAGSVGDHALSLTAFHVAAKKGIASDATLASGARYWRYPDLSHTLVAGRATSRIAHAVSLDSALWYQAFGQAIDSYSGPDYETVANRQVDRDRTWGLRELLSYERGPLLLVSSFNLLESTHRQRDIAYAGGQPPASLPAALLYRQRNWSVGGELEYELSAVLRAELAFGYDVMEYVRTGDKPDVPDAEGWTGGVGLVYAMTPEWTLRAAIGRKIRAPTLRERFGEAINRFLPAPDLLPERIISAELAAEWQGREGGFYLIPFYQDLANTIDQRTVGRLRQRINLQGSDVWGVEGGGEWRPLDGLTLAGNATWTRVRRTEAPASGPNRIAEKPSLIANASAEYRLPAGPSLLVEAQHLGRAYSAGGDGLVALPRSTSINGRIGVPITLSDREAEVFVHAYNLFDAQIVPQLGLPAPGFTLLAGLKIG